MHSDAIEMEGKGQAGLGEKALSFSLCDPGPYIRYLTWYQVRVCTEYISLVAMYVFRFKGSIYSKIETTGGPLAF